MKRKQRLKNNRKRLGSARSNTGGESRGPRDIMRSIARDRMEAAGISQINKKVKIRSESRGKSKFARLWRKYVNSVNTRTHAMRRIGKKGNSYFIAV